MKSINKAAVLRTYGWYAPIYNVLFGRILEAGRIELARSLSRGSPHRLLEIGVGTGLALRHYSVDTEVFGVDISLDMLRRAQILLGRRNLGHVALACCDAEQLPFADGYFDCVALPYVLSVTPDPQRLLSEAQRVCATGGRIFVLNHFAGAGGWRIAERLLEPIADRVGFRSNLTLQALDSPRWKIVEVRPVNLFGLSRLVEISNERA